MDDEDITIGQDASLDIVKTGVFNDDITADGFGQVGETITYTFVTTNDGNVTISGVVVSDPLGGGLTLSCGMTSNGDTFNNDGTDSLDPGESVTCTATYSLTQADIDAGEVLNTATVTGTDTNGGL